MTTDYVLCGIDPGLKGGIAILNEDGCLIAANMPVLRSDNGKNNIDAKRVCEILKINKVTHAAIELVHSRPHDGSVASFTFGKGYGTVIGIMEALGIHVAYTRPQEWKKHYGLIGTDKNASRTKATEIFPDSECYWKRKKDDGVAEAALILKYGAETVWHFA